MFSSKLSGSSKNLLSIMQFLLLFIVSQCLVSARFNRRAALIKFHQKSVSKSTEKMDMEDKDDLSVLAEAKPLKKWNGVRTSNLQALASKRSKQNKQMASRQHMLNMIASSTSKSKRKYQAMLQKFLKEHGKESQMKNTLQYAFYSLNLI